MNSPSESELEEYCCGKLSPGGSVPGGGERLSVEDPNGCCEHRNSSH